MPNLEVSSQIQASGTSLINVFAADLFDFIDKELKKSLGANWQVRCLKIAEVG